MPRRLLKKILPDRHSLAQRWYLHPFRALMHQPAYWTVHRRSVVRAVAIGLFVCFIPLPVHFLLAPLVALLGRANLPLTLATVLLMNPLTFAPAYFGAYWVGSQLTGEPLIALHFEPTWEWVDTQLRVIWKPFLLGCLVIGSTAALLGYYTVSLWWRAAVTHRYQRRPAKLRARNGAIEENSGFER
jgi:uncharacterized protein (DUF2062 family)